MVLFIRFLRDSLRQKPHKPGNTRQANSLLFEPQCVIPNGVQFKLFLKMIQGCMELKNDLTFFNGTDFFVHVPYKHLVESIITTNVDTYTLAEHLINKSKIEAEVTK